jgi:hypothetical protein
MSGNLKVDVDVSGLKPVLQTLMVIDRDLYKKVTADIKAQAMPVANKIGQDFPVTVLSGFTKKRTKASSNATFPKYNAATVRKSVKPIVGGRKRSSSNTYPILKLRTKDGAAQIFDMAQNQQTPGNTFVHNLKGQGYGDASRVMWKSTLRHLPMVERLIISAVKTVEQSISADLVRSIQNRKASSSRVKGIVRTSGRFGLN